MGATVEDAAVRSRATDFDNVLRSLLSPCPRWFELADVEEKDPSGVASMESGACVAVFAGRG